MGWPQWPAVLKQAYGRWSKEETDALLAEWKRLGRRGRGGAARTDCLGLAVADWCELANAVNTYRAGAGLDSIRTYEQCKSRLRYVTGKNKARAAAAEGEKALVLWSPPVALLESSRVAMSSSGTRNSKLRSATSSGTRNNCKRKRGATEAEAVPNSRSFAAGSGDASAGGRTGCSADTGAATGRSRSSFVKEDVDAAVVLGLADAYVRLKQLNV